MKQYSSVSLIERIISAATYMTTGLVGFVWLIIGVLLKKMPTPFLMYHIFQSIFLSITFFLFFELLKMISRIPFLKIISIVLSNPVPICYNMSILQIITTTLLIYLVITSFMGLYSYVPYVSNIINANINRK